MYASDDTLVVTLTDDGVVTLPLGWFPRLYGATQAARDDWQLVRPSGSGHSIHWESLGLDISVSQILTMDAEWKASRSEHERPPDGKSTDQRLSLSQRTLWLWQSQRELMQLFATRRPRIAQFLVQCAQMRRPS